MLNGLIGLATVSYPFLVYLAMDDVQPRYVALLLAAVFLLRWLKRKEDEGMERTMTLLAAAGALFLIAAGLANEAPMLLGYPVFMSALFFAWFYYSLLYPPTIVEKLARLQDPVLPPQGIIYTRKVTGIWCGFFLVNSLISMGTIWYGDRWVWSLYNGCISYVLMGTLMAVEMTVRKRVRESFWHAG
jgi:uncharacterized membrane protein